MGSKRGLEGSKPDGNRKGVLNMKENAILIASIAFITGCAHQQGSYTQADYERDQAYSALDADSQRMTTEQLPRDVDGRVATSPDGTSIQAQGTMAGSASRSQSSSNAEIQADSSERGTSLRARGIELTDVPTEIEANQETSSQSRTWQDQGGELESQANVQVEGELNASDRLENNISGEYDLDRQLDESAVGAAAGSETQSARSDSLEQSDLLDSDVIPSDAERLFDSNPAQGVGGLAAPNTATTTDVGQDTGDLASRVKQKLAAESTGTHGLMRHQVARNVEVTAADGVVTLRGTVPSQQDKDILTIRAREIPGVEEVRNEVTVSPAADPAQRDLSPNQNTSQD